MLAKHNAKVVDKSGFAADKIEDVVVGCANQAGEIAAASHATRRWSPGCRSRSRVRVAAAIAAAVSTRSRCAQAITCGEGDVFCRRRRRSMSRAPFVMGKAESAYSRDARVFDSTIGARFPTEG